MGRPIAFNGSFRRGELMPVTLAFVDLPDAAPTARVYSAGATVDTFQLPLVDRVEQVFGLEYFVGPDLSDGGYVLGITWRVGGVFDCQLSTFRVRGGRGRQPLAAVIELKRPLGHAVVSFDDAGQGEMGYNPRPER